MGEIDAPTEARPRLDPRRARNRWGEPPTSPRRGVGGSAHGIRVRGSDAAPCHRRGEMRANGARSPRRRRHAPAQPPYRTNPVGEPPTSRAFGAGGVNLRRAAIGTKYAANETRSPPRRRHAPVKTARGTNPVGRASDVTSVCERRSQKFVKVGPLCYTVSNYCAGSHARYSVDSAGRQARWVA